MQHKHMSDHLIIEEPFVHSSVNPHIISPYIDPTAKHVNMPAAEAVLIFKPFDFNVTTNSVLSKLLQEFVASKALADLADYGYRVVGRYSYTGQQLQLLQLPFKHYSTIYAKTVGGKKNLSPIAKQLFQGKFQESFEAAEVLGAYEAMERFDLNSEQLNNFWQAQFAEQGGQYKLDDGLYCAKRVINDQPVFILNGFFPRQCEYFYDTEHLDVLIIRGQKNSPGLNIMRSEYLGETVPAVASKKHPDSIRGQIYTRFNSLFPRENVIHPGNNAVHLSAGPLEAMKEQMLWFSLKTKQTVFGRILLREHYTEEDICQFMDNPLLKDSDGINKSLFELTEALDYDEVLDFLKQNFH